MIIRDDMFAPLLAADPTFEPRWFAFNQVWKGRQHPPLYLALGDLAEHLVGDLEIKRTITFAAVFDVVERWHVEGDPYVKEAAAIGLLESLQNPALFTTSLPSDFLPWLGPQSSRSWYAIEAFWDGR